MIDLSIAVVSRNGVFFPEETARCWAVGRAGSRIACPATACVVRVAGAGGGREDPALPRIEYHRLSCGFFRRNPGRGRMAIVLALRTAKSLVDGVSQASLALRVRAVQAEAWG